MSRSSIFISFAIRRPANNGSYSASWSDIAFTFEGLALIPIFVMRYPRNGPSFTPKEHFLGLSFILIVQSLSKVSWMSAMSSFDSLFITMSSTWTSRFCPI
ncbi:hypothetical protein Tco_0936698 [Tanacetum coccineum]|uniref:Uncharacterized protein n=1 Tax=Tanacetum coccineum TaxID=301880 RepID=A0ABQ5DD07_9ASTR